MFKFIIMSECQSLQSGKKWRMEMSKMSIYSNTIYEKKLEYFELHYPQNSFLIDMTLNSYRKVELGKWIHRKTSVWNVFIPRNQWIFRNEFPSIIWLDFPISEHIKRRLSISFWKISVEYIPPLIFHCVTSYCFVQSIWKELE